MRNSSVLYGLALAASWFSSGLAKQCHLANGVSSSLASKAPTAASYGILTSSGTNMDPDQPTSLSAAESSAVTSVSDSSNSDAFTALTTEATFTTQGIPQEATPETTTVATFLTDTASDVPIIDPTITGTTSTANTTSNFAPVVPTTNTARIFKDGTTSSAVDDTTTSHSSVANAASDMPVINPTTTTVPASNDNLSTLLMAETTPSAPIIELPTTTVQVSESTTTGLSSTVETTSDAPITDPTTTIAPISHELTSSITTIAISTTSLSPILATSSPVGANSVISNVNELTVKYWSGSPGSALAFNRPVAENGAQIMVAKIEESTNRLMLTNGWYVATTTGGSAPVYSVQLAQISGGTNFIPLICEPARQGQALKCSARGTNKSQFAVDSGAFRGLYIIDPSAPTTRSFVYVIPGQLE